MEMFQPVFVYDSQRITPTVELARSKKFRMVDVREAGTSAHGGNPAVVVYDQNVQLAIDDVNGAGRFLPPKNTGVMVLFDIKKGKGHVRALPDRVEFVEWFWEAKVEWFNPLTGNFRVGPPKNKPVVAVEAS